MRPALFVLLAVAQGALGADPILPRWTPTWLTNESTMIQPCNEGGPLNLTTVSQWGVTSVISYNNMSGSGWLFQRPMNEEEDEITQAQLIERA